MGGWAFIANWSHGMNMAIKAALVQALLTAIITLFMKNVIERVTYATSGTWGRIAPSLVAALISLTFLFIFHSIAGTPEILGTLAVPMLVSTIYAALYSKVLRNPQ